MVTLNINGHDHSVDVPNDTPLLWVIREHLQMTGTKFGCGAGLCGACTVHLNGEAVRSCQTAVSQAAGKKITTIEGLDPKGEHPLQTRLDRRAGAAMRLLPVRADHAGRIAARQEHRSHQSRSRRAHGRQSLPLHELRAYPARHPARGCRNAGSVSHDEAREDSTRCRDIDRRSFIVGTAATGLVIGYAAPKIGDIARRNGRQRRAEHLGRHQP